MERVPYSPECVIRYAVIAEIAHKVHVVRSSDHDGVEQVKDTAKVALVRGDRRRGKFARTILLRPGQGAFKKFWKSGAISHRRTLNFVVH